MSALDFDALAALAATPVCSACGVAEPWHLTHHGEPAYERDVGDGPPQADRCGEWVVHVAPDDLRALIASSRALEAEHTPRPRDTWHEDDGSVLWWSLPVREPPYAGTPLDDDFPDYVTHWTPCPVPLSPEGER